MRTKDINTQSHWNTKWLEEGKDTWRKYPNTYDLEISWLEDNKSHMYKRDLDDWIELCHQCHMKYDGSGRKARITRRKNKMPLVNKIRKMYKTNKYKQRDLAVMFNCDQSSISLIVRRKTWA